MDDELRDLFESESQERLQDIEDQLLALEEGEAEADALDRIRRQAHSLKGSARMLGLDAIETVAHGLEDSLEVLEEGALDPQTFDLLFDALDAIRALTRAVLDEEDADVDPEALAQRLRALAPGEEPHPATTDETASEPDQPSQQTPPDSGGSAPSPERIETIRVPPERLDELLRLAGELRVAALRTGRRRTEVTELQASLEDLRRSLASVQTGRGRQAATTVQGSERLDELWRTVRSANEQLSTLATSTQEDANRLEFLADAIEREVRTARLLPFETIFRAFQRMVRDLTQDADKEIDLEIQGEDTTADKRILEEIRDPLTHLVRNAVAHGIEEPDEREAQGKPRAGTVRIEARREGSNVVVEVADDGRGIDLEDVAAEAVDAGVLTEAQAGEASEAEIRDLIFHPGLSTSPIVTDVSGRGVGLDVVRRTVEDLEGSVTVGEPEGGGTRFVIELPVTVATARALVVDLGGHPYGIPTERVESVRRLDPDDVFRMEGQSTIEIDGDPIPVDDLAGLLDLDTEISRPGTGPDEHLPCVVVSAGGQRAGLIVDQIVREQEIVLKGIGGVLKRVANTSAATVLGTGRVCVILRPQELVRSVAATARYRPHTPQDDTEAPSGARLVLAEDSLTTRARLARILEGEGYEVLKATDGREALDLVRQESVDGLVTDVQMPRMDGFELTEIIRSSADLEDLPIIIVTSLASEEDKRRGVEAGADAYVTKSGFDQTELLETLGRLV